MVKKKKTKEISFTISEVCFDRKNRTVKNKGDFGAVCLEFLHFPLCSCKDHGNVSKPLSLN